MLAFDFGEKRIGVAVGDLALKIAHPLMTIDEEANDARFAEIGALVQEWQPVRFVVGLPRHADGTEHTLAPLVRRFVQRLDGRYGGPVTLVDERLTSATAETRLRESGARASRIGEVLDAAAAQEILQSYLDHI